MRDLGNWAVAAFYGAIFGLGRLSTHLHQSDWIAQAVAVVSLMIVALALTYADNTRREKAQRKAIKILTGELEDRNGSN